MDVEIPKFNIDRFSKGEAGHLPALEHNCNSLRSVPQMFRAALSLADSSLDGMRANAGDAERYRMFRLWRVIAGKELCTQVWFMRQSLRASIASIKSLPSLSKAMPGLKEVLLDFDSNFPSAEPMRHAVAHFFELAESQHKMKLHLFDAGEGQRHAMAPKGPHFGIGWEGANLCVVHGGKMHRLAANESTALQLDSLRDRAFALLSEA